LFTSKAGRRGKMFRYNKKRAPRSVQLEASTIVHKGPCLVMAVSVCANGANATVNLYDGVSTGGERKLTIAVTNGLTLSPVIVSGIEFKTGLYVTLGAATDLTTISLYPGELAPDDSEVEIIE
jgi:hypothetical protein